MLTAPPYGHGASWQLSAEPILATAQLAGLNPVTYLTAYLDECGRHGGKPLSGEALARSLPWNASPEDLRTWAQPPPNGKTPDQ